MASERGESVPVHVGWAQNSGNSQNVWVKKENVEEAKGKATQKQDRKIQRAGLTCLVGKAGFMEFAHVELQPDDGKHHDGEEEEQPNLQQGHHGLHDGLEDNLQAWGDTKTPQGGKENKDMGMERRWERGGNLGLVIPSNAALPRVPQTHFLP